MGFEGTPRARVKESKQLFLKPSVVRHLTMNSWNYFTFTYTFFPFFKKNSCSSTIVSIFIPPFHSGPTHPGLPPLNLTPLALSMCPLYKFLDGPSCIIPLPSPLWLLSVCSLFQCLWLSFARLFVLLIRLHLQVRSYGISLSMPGFSNAF